jgi:hypothetical protein
VLLLRRRVTHSWTRIGLTGGHANSVGTRRGSYGQLSPTISGTQSLRRAPDPVSKRPDRYVMQRGEPFLGDVHCARVRRRLFRARVVRAFCNNAVFTGRLWGVVGTPVKGRGDKPRHGVGRAVADDMPRVKSQRSDLRKRGDSTSSRRQGAGEEPVYHYAMRYWCCAFAIGLGRLGESGGMSAPERKL